MANDIYGHIIALARQSLSLSAKFARFGGSEEKRNFAERLSAYACISYLRYVFVVYFYVCCSCSLDII